MTLSRLAGAAALAFVSIVLAANIILRAAGLPASDAGSDVVSAFVAGHATQVGIASALAPLAWLALTVFGVGATARVWRGEQSRGEVWSLVGVVGIGMQNVLFAGVVATQVAMLAPGPTAALWNLHNALFSLNGITLAMTLLGFSIGGLRTATMRRWHGGLGLVAAVLLLASSMLTPVALSGGAQVVGVAGFVGFVLWLVWLTAFGMVLLRDRHRPDVALPAPSAPAALAS